MSYLLSGGQSCCSSTATMFQLAALQQVPTDRFSSKLGELEAPAQVVPSVPHPIGVYCLLVKREVSPPILLAPSLAPLVNLRCAATFFSPRLDRNCSGQQDVTQLALQWPNELNKYALRRLEMRAKDVKREM